MIVKYKLENQISSALINKVVRNNKTHQKENTETKKKTKYSN